MVSLGTEAFCDVIKCKNKTCQLGLCTDPTKLLTLGPLSCDTAGNIVTTGSLKSAHHQIGGTYDSTELRHHESLVYLKYDENHQCVSTGTTSGSDDVTWVLAVNHNLEVGDTVAIGSYANGGNADANGIPHTSCVGSFLVTAIPTSTTFSVDTTNNATSTGVVAGVTSICQIHRFKYLDMHSSGVTWQYSTTLPTTGGHSNPEAFFS